MPSTQLCCEPKILQKNKVYFLKREERERREGGREGGSVQQGIEPKFLKSFLLNLFLNTCQPSASQLLAPSYQTTVVCDGCLCLSHRARGLNPLKAASCCFPRLPRTSSAGLLGCRLLSCWSCSPGPAGGKVAPLL